MVDDQAQGPTRRGRWNRVGAVLARLAEVLTAVVRGVDAGSGVGPGAGEHDAGRRSDTAAQRRRQYRP